MAGNSSMAHSLVDVSIAAGSILPETHAGRVIWPLFWGYRLHLRRRFKYCSLKSLWSTTVATWPLCDEKVARLCPGTLSWTPPERPSPGRALRWHVAESPILSWTPPERPSPGRALRWHVAESPMLI